MRRVLALLAALLAGLSPVRAESAPAADSAANIALPDAREVGDGRVVRNAVEWRSRRAPELRELFQREMYGRLPAAPARVAGRVLFEDRAAFDGAGVLREVELSFGPPEWPKIYLLIASPAGEAPAPCFVGCNFGGNHLRVDDRRVRLATAWMPEGFPGVVDHRATDAGRGKQDEGWDVWPLEAAVRRGYSVATFYCGDVQPDRPAVREGMRATTPELGAGDATGAIMWWAWGIHRAVDYLVTDARVDPQRIAVVGHSRLGKTALVAGAFDDRIALAVANQAGCGGSGPSRHNDPRAETVAIITTKFPHWFCKSFRSYGDDPARLPFDQNCLVALYAPRPVLFTAAAGDVWANPAGQFAVLRSASPVYELLGATGLKAGAMPAPGDPLVASRLGYWIRPGEHAMTRVDWGTFLDFADAWLK